MSRQATACDERRRDELPNVSTAFVLPLISTKVLRPTKADGWCEISTAYPFSESRLLDRIAQDMAPEIIRRKWTGFGECEITILPAHPSSKVSFLERLAAIVPLSLCRAGFTALRFTVDPAWIACPNSAQASPVVARFLHTCGKELKQEWESHGSTHVAPVQQTASLISDSLPKVAPCLTPRPHTLPSWFRACCSAPSATAARPRATSR